MNIQTPPTTEQPLTSEENHANQPQGTNQSEDGNQEEGDNQPGGGASPMVAIAAGTTGGVIGLLVLSILFTCVICLCRQVQIQVHFCQREKSKGDTPLCNRNVITTEMHLQTNKVYSVQMATNDQPVGTILKANDDNSYVSESSLRRDTTVAPDAK